MIRSLGLRASLVGIAAAAIACGSGSSAPTTPTSSALPAIPTDVSATLRSMLQSLVADIDGFRLDVLIAAVNFPD